MITRIMLLRAHFRSFVWFQRQRHFLSHFSSPLHQEAAGRLFVNFFLSLSFVRIYVMKTGLPRGMWWI